VRDRQQQPDPAAAAAMSHAGTALELSVPIIFLVSPGGASLVVEDRV
jgi:hypothetical protein